MFDPHTLAVDPDAHRYALDRAADRRALAVQVECRAFAQRDVLHRRHVERLDRALRIGASGRARGDPRSERLAHEVLPDQRRLAAAGHHGQRAVVVVADPHPDDRIDNSAFTEGSYRPANSSGHYSESITLADAFAQSSNVAAVRLQQQVGSDAVIAMARALGVTAPLAEGDPSLALGTSTMTLLELTAAYAGVAGNSFPVKPTAFPLGEPGWTDWFFDGKDSLSGSTHAAIEEMLRRAINGGTGRAAMLSIPNFGKTGTTQDHRDALFVGYAGDLVVGVWIGNDDNSPLPGVTGGSLPARIWKDFMLQAMGRASAPAPRVNPSGPVKPLDVPDVGDIPLGEDATLTIGQGGVGVSGAIEGVPVDVRVDGDGVRITPGQRPSPAPSPSPGERQLDDQVYQQQRQRIEQQQPAN